MAARRIPRLCRHRGSGQGYVNDPATRKEVYLGVWGSQECNTAYDRWVREYLARGDPKHLPGTGCTVRQLLDAWLTWADGWYRKRGKPTAQVRNAELVCRGILAAGYAKLPADQFGPRQLKAVRQTWIDAELARKTINGWVKLVVSAWAWGVEHEMVNALTVEALREVKGLPAGRTAAKESEEVKPVDELLYQTTLPLLPEKVQAVAMLQWHTGMRPAEALGIRPCDLDRSAEPWVYTVQPEWNKTAHKDRTRTVYLAAAARAILAPWLLRCPSPDAYLFSSRFGPSRPYSVVTYRHTIAAACAGAGLPHWHPNQLRHAYATRARAKLGIEAAQGLLGHGDLNTSELYAERDAERDRKNAEGLG